MAAFTGILKAEQNDTYPVSILEIITITASVMESPPEWAIIERRLIKTMKEGAHFYLAQNDSQRHGFGIMYIIKYSMFRCFIQIATP